MNLNDLNTMQRADKYTQDGRDAIIKAQTEDKVYQIGEISQKTGLQKTANGWVQPKKMLGGKAKKPDGDPRTDRQIANQAGYSVYRDGESKNGEYREFRNGDDIIRFDKNGYDDRAGGKKYSAMESGPGGTRRFFDTFQEAADWVKNGSQKEAVPAPQRKAQSSSSLKGYLENNFWSQPEDFENDIKEAGWDIEEMNGEYAVVSNEAGSQYEVRFSPHGDGHDLTMESFTPLMIDEDDEDDDIDDSAPRTLTGDTRLRLSQVTDRVYKPGEISEKTGLQKQPDGSWAPPRNGGIL